MPGVALLGAEESGTEAIRRADQAMYLAKRAGNNVQAPHQATQGAHKAVTSVADISAAFARMYPSTPA